MLIFRYARILSPSRQSHNTLNEKGLHTDSPAAPNLAPNATTSTAQHTDFDTETSIHNVDAIVKAIMEMSKADRKKVLAALLDLAVW